MSWTDIQAPIKGGRFQIFLRRRQLQANYPPPNGTFQNVVVNCDPLTGAATYAPGNVDNTSNYSCDPDNDFIITPVNTWYDFSNFIEGEDKLQFTWDKWNNGDSQAANKDGSNYDKGVTSDLIFRDCAFHFLYDWLLTTPCQIINFVEVKIIDLIARGNEGATADPAGNYRIFEIKPDNLEYAPLDEPCVFKVKLREQDEVWHCIHKTVIWDNWQGWFGGDGTAPTREFPCFHTCIEPRPRLLMSARMALMLFWESLIVDGIPLIAGILWFLNKKGLIAHAREVLNANKFVDAPQVYDYILNVAMKCNMAVDTEFNPGHDLENVCIYFPSAGQMKEFDDPCNDCDPISPDLFFTYDNRWLVTLADLLDKLKVVFAAEWYVTPNNTIVFKFTKDLIQLLPIYDYTLPGAEPIYGLKYSFNGDKKPAYGRYQYQVDGSDLASQEMDTLYNDIVDFDGSAFNPMLEGDKTKNFEFAPTGFVGDGRSKNYLKLLINDAEIGAFILLAILAIAITLIVGLSVFTLGGQITFIVYGVALLTWATLIANNRNDLRNEFVRGTRYKGAVRLTCEQVMTPRLLLWDGISKQKAKVDARVGEPVPHPYYNPTNIPYTTANQVLIDNDNNNGGFGVYNYPLYFDSMYYGNLFHKYHDMIDNPLKSIETHQQFRFYVDLCVDQLNLYGVFQNQFAQIGKIVKIESRPGYDVYGRIGNINVDYSSNQIVISGIVIRKPASSVDDLNPGNIPVVTPEESLPIETPTNICYKFRNAGTDPVTITYMDCNGILVDDTIMPGFRICALEILSQDPATMLMTDSCDSGSLSGSQPSPGSGVFPPPPGCIPKIYRANLRQDPIDPSTNNPIVNVYENTDNYFNIVWSRFDTGEWHGDMVAGFPVGLTWFQGNEPVPIVQGSVAYFLSDNTDQVIIYLSDFSGNPSDFVLGEGIASIEIIVYCPPCEAPDISDFNILPPAAICLGEPPIIQITSTTLLPGHSYTINYTSTNPAGSSSISGRVLSGTLLQFFTENTNNTDPVVVTIDSIIDEENAVCETAVGIDVPIDSAGRFVSAGDDRLMIVGVDTDTGNLDGSTSGDGDSQLWTTSGDGTFDDATILSPIYTPGAGDIAGGAVVLTLTVSGSTSPCPDVSDSMTVYISDHEIEMNIDTPSNGYDVSVGLQFFQTGIVDWGDGSPREFYTNGSFTITHNYATAGNYTPIFYFNAFNVSSFVQLDPNIQVNTFVCTNIGTFGTIVLEGVMDTDVIMTGIATISNAVIQLIGNASSAQTTADFTGLPSSTQVFSMQGFPALTTISNVPVDNSPLYNVGFFTCPLLTDLDSGSTWKPRIFSVSGNAAGIAYPTFDLSVCTVFGITGDITTTDVNNYLIALDANGLSNGTVFLQETPAAPPSGAGATAKTNLQGKGWTVTTD